LAHTKKEGPAKAGPLFWSYAKLVVAHAEIIATPPVRAPGDEGLAAQPPAIVVGVVIPNPDAIHEYPMTMMEAVKVVSALREAAVLEPLAAVVALYEPTTIAAVETATSWSRAIKVAACIRSGTAIGAAGEVAATARHCAGMAGTTATTTIATTMPAAAAAAADKCDDAIMACAQSALEVRRASRLSWPQHQRG
jgi:hypothetical protein